MTRRSFIQRLMAAWAALFIPYPEEGPHSIAVSLNPTEVDRWLQAEQERLAAMIVRNYARPSPWLALLEPVTFPPVTFPHGAGAMIQYRVETIIRDGAQTLNKS